MLEIMPIGSCLSIRWRPEEQEHYCAKNVHGPQHEHGRAIVAARAGQLPQQGRPDEAARLQGTRRSRWPAWYCHSSNKHGCSSVLLPQALDSFPSKGPPSEAAYLQGTEVSCQSADFDTTSFYAACGAVAACPDCSQP